MKKLILFLSLFGAFVSFSQTNTDILFVGFNADGDDDFSVLLMNDFEPFTELYFTDNEPNVDGDGNVGGEGVLLWNSGSAVLKKGTIVVFTDVDNGANANFGSSVGSLSIVNAGFNISASGDVLYATYGDPSANEVSTWVAAIQNSNTGYEANFAETGLSSALNYVIIDATASKDGGAYLFENTIHNIEETRGLILDEENWLTNTSDGESILPFQSDSIGVLLNATNSYFKESIEFSANNGVLTVSKGKIVAIVSLNGAVVNNNIHTLKGVYVVIVLVNNKLIKTKIIF